MAVTSHTVPIGVPFFPQQYMVTCPHCGQTHRNVRAELVRTGETDKDGNYMDVILGFDSRDVCECLCKQWTEVTPIIINSKNITQGDVLN